MYHNIVIKCVLVYLEWHSEELYYIIQSAEKNHFPCILIILQCFNPEIFNHICPGNQIQFQITVILKCITLNYVNTDFRLWKILYCGHKHKQWNYFVFYYYVTLHSKHTRKGTSIMFFAILFHMKICYFFLVI